MTTNNPIVTLVYAGVFLGTTRKLYNKYYQLVDGTLSTESWAFDAKTKGQRQMGGSVGLLYEVERDPVQDDRIFPGTAKSVGRYDDAEQVIAWEAQSRSAKAEHAAYLSRYKDTRFSALKHQMAPIRDAYQSLPAPARQQFLAQLVSFLYTAE